MKPISQVLKEVLKDKQSNYGKMYAFAKLKANWPDIVGESIARHTEPIKYQDGQLRIKVSSAAALQEVLFIQVAIKEQINRYMECQWVHTIHLNL